MYASDIRALIIEDNICKAMDIKEALKSNGIKTIIHLDNQEEAWEVIVNSHQGNNIDLIVTDMQYPLSYNSIVDKEAGFKLIERLNREEINIPIVVCSSINYRIPGILGCVWYSKLRDLQEDFNKMLEKLSYVKSEY